MSFLLVRLSALLFSIATSANHMMITDVEESGSGKVEESDGDGEKTDKIVTVKRSYSGHMTEILISVSSHSSLKTGSA